MCKSSPPAIESDIVNILDQNGRNTIGNNDAYVDLATDVQFLDLSNGITGSLGDTFNLLGRAAGFDLGGADAAGAHRNNTRDEVALAFLDTIDGAEWCRIDF